MGNTKIFWTIKELASELEVPVSTIRYWESQFPKIKPHHIVNGSRYYTKGEKEQVKKIYHLVKERKLTIEGAKDVLKKNPQIIDKKMEVLESLNKVREDLKGMIDMMTHIRNLREHNSHQSE